MFCHVTDPHLVLLLAGVGQGVAEEGRGNGGPGPRLVGPDDPSEDWTLFAGLSVLAILLGLALLVA